MSPKEKILIYLKKLKKEKIKFIGVSLYTIFELKVLKVFKPDIIQFPLNIFYTDCSKKMVINL